MTAWQAYGWGIITGIAFTFVLSAASFAVLAVIGFFGGQSVEDTNDYQL